ncbi:MAG: UDP-N-acetylmuramoyl-tripeptide--D-alanyl-D-alanine ligase [Proteobacteria bacterium]|nr:UDP-N-acetylmuramoyl-tripeptide--D-alanyl-D-alanine ligase [Pseudomonadota bacterium]
MRLTLHHILDLQHTRLLHADEPRRAVITGVSTDSRTVRKGDVFFALRGDRFDGHNFLTKASGMGAYAAVIEERWASTNEPLLASLRLPLVVVQDAVQSLGELASAYRRQFSIPLIAVVGSNGKTTTKEMISAVLKRRFSVLSTEGNLNNHIGVPQTIFTLEKTHDVAVLELGTNHFGEVDTLCRIAQPTHGMITNIGSEHLEFFGDLDGVARAEGELAVWLRTHRGPSARVIVNNDDPVVRKLFRGFGMAMTYGMTSGSVDLQGTITTDRSSRSSVLILQTEGGRPVAVRLSVPGRHSAMNALAAAAVGRALRVPFTEIKKALESFRPANKRTHIKRIAGITILDDTYNANPDSVRAALETLEGLPSEGKKIAVLGDMLELGGQSEAEHRAIGDTLSGGSVEYLLTYGEQAQAIHDAAAVSFKAHYDQKNMLAEYLIELVTPGDAVLVKGSRGMRMEDVVTFLVERLSRTLTKTGS